MSEVFYADFKDFVFESAVAFLRGRRVLTKDEYRKLSERARARAFTVSGYTALSVLQEFSDRLTKAVEEGQSAQQFREDMNGFLADEGLDELNAWRTDVIFRTNIQTSYNAGHYESMTRPEVLRLRPFWQYKTAGDDKVRPDHAIMEGAVYLASDPIWDVWYPPNGYQCRCSVVSLSRNQMKQRGLEVREAAPTTVDYETGEIKMVMPDKGFAANPAKDVYRPDMSNIGRPLRSIWKQREKRSRSAQRRR